MKYCLHYRKSLEEQKRILLTVLEACEKRSMMFPSIHALAICSDRKEALNSANPLIHPDFIDKQL